MGVVALFLMHFVINATNQNEQSIEKYLRTSQDEFTVEDESFFLEKLDYEVMAE